MYLLVAGKPNSEVTYFGPFPNIRRAEQYGESATELGYRWHVVPLVVPNCVVATVILKY